MIPDLPVYIAKALKANPKAWAFFRAGMALSARELEVLELLGKGKSNREIAAELAITEATVKAHVTNILSRLGVSDRTQAVITALKRRPLVIGTGIPYKSRVPLSTLVA